MSSRRGLLSRGPSSAQRSREGSARSSTIPASSSTRHATSSRAPQDKIQLPPYEAPTCPPDLTARRALSEVASNATETRKYTAELANSIKLLGETVAEINDRHTERKQLLDSRLERQRGGSSADNEEGGDVDEDMRALQDTVEGLAQKVRRRRARGH
jgi:hypothetical protein